jgi:iron complex transport system substrate-binding protein
MGSITKAVLTFVLLAFPVGAEAEVFRDAVGRQVAVSVPSRRIVSLAPNLTETLFSLGLEREVAGVTLFCDWPLEAVGKPKVGGFVNPSLEAIVALEPDLVLATADGNRESDVLRLESLGVPVYVTDSRSVSDIMETIHVVGLLTGRKEEAGKLVTEMTRRRDRVREAVADRPAVSVFIALDRSPLVTAGKGTFVDELVRLAGGRNIVDSPAVKYPVFSAEQLLARDPQVIVEAAGAGDGSTEAVARWERLPGGGGLRAVREGRVYEIGEGDFFRPGPRVMGALERLAMILHPESFR